MNVSTLPSRILITGSSGFVGGHLTAACRARYPDAMIYGLSHGHVAHPAQFQRMATEMNLRLIEADMTQPDQVQRAIALSKPDLIFHLAGQPSVAASWSNPAATLAINAAGALHLFEALRAVDIAPRVVLIGSGEQYGLVRPDENPITEDCLPRPANPYAVAKVTQDLYGYQYFVAYGLPVMRVRAFNHFGPRQIETFVIASFARQIARIEAGLAEPTLLVGNLETQRDFLPVCDVIRAYIAIAERGRPGAAYNVGSGHARSIHEMLDLLLALSTTRITIQTDPARLRPADVPLLVADITQLRADTGWQPEAPIETALRETLDAWRASVG